MLTRVWHRLLSCKREKRLILFSKKKIHPFLSRNNFQTYFYYNTYITLFILLHVLHLAIRINSFFKRLIFFYHGTFYLTTQKLFIWLKEKSIIVRCKQIFTQWNFRGVIRYCFGSTKVVPYSNRSSKNSYHRFRAIANVTFVSLLGYSGRKRAEF